MENASNKIKYISEVIQDDYKNWNNEMIAFDAPTSSGKTYFVLNILCE